MLFYCFMLHSMEVYGKLLHHDQPVSGWPPHHANMISRCRSSQWSARRLRCEILVRAHAHGNFFVGVWD